MKVPGVRRPLPLRILATVVMLCCFGYVPVFFSQQNWLAALGLAIVGGIALSYAFSRTRDQVR